MESEAVQYYLKAIYDLQSERDRVATTVLADRLGVAPPSATTMVAPIPAANGAIKRRASVSMAGLAPGERGTVAEVSDHDPGLLRCSWLRATRRQRPRRPTPRVGSRPRPSSWLRATSDRIAGLVAATLIALAATTGLGCGDAVVDASAAPDLSNRPIRIVTTVGMITDIVENVGGPRVDVTGLMGPGIDPHVYKASEGDVIELAEADAVFFNGLHLEAKLAEVFERMRGRVRTFAVTDGIPRSALLAPPAFAGNYDPHVWFDVTLWMRATEAVRGGLTELDRAHAPLYRANARRYLARLRELHAYVQRRAALVPRDRRVIITAHDAFNYFGRRYGFEVRGLQGISTASEAGTADVRRLAEFIVERRIPAMFVESSVSPRAIEAVREAVESRGFDVAIGRQLFSDAMGDPGTPEGTYVGMVRHNVDSIVAGLLGQEPGG